MTGLAIKTVGVTKRYGRTAALDSVDLDLAADRIHGLLGRNAAGKSTLLSLMASLDRPDSGRIELGGEDPFENEALMEQICLIRESGDVLGDEPIKTKSPRPDQWSARAPWHRWCSR